MCYVRLWGRAVRFRLFHLYEGVRFNVICAARGWGEGSNSQQKQHATPEWLLMSSYNNSGNLCRGFVDRGWTVKFDFQEKSLHDSKLDQCIAPNLTMCLLYLSVYGCCQLTDMTF